MDYKLKALPETISNLIEYIIARIESDCGPYLTRLTFGILISLIRPISSNELHRLIDHWINLHANRKKDNQHPTLKQDYWQLLANMEESDESDLDRLLNRELNIQNLLFRNNQLRLTTDNKNVKNMDVDDDQSRYHLPSLFFQMLLINLRPLLSGLGDSFDPNELDDENVDEENLEYQKKLNLWNLDARVLVLRSDEVRKSILNVCFNESTKSTVLSNSSLLGFQKSFQTSLFKLDKRVKVDFDNIGDMNYFENNTFDLSDIHRLLATHLPGLENKIYHFVN